MSNRISPLIIGLLLDAILYLFVVGFGGYVFSWQALTYCIAVFGALSVAYQQGTLSLSKKYCWHLFAVLLIGPAVRSGLMNTAAAGLFITHPFLMFLPALAITGVSVSLFVGKKISVENIEFVSTKTLLVIAGIILLLRSFFLGSIELLPEEGYYWNYGTHLAAGYIDHPPVVGILIRLGTSLFGTNETSVRFFGCVCSLITVVLLGLLHRRLFGDRGWHLTIALAAISPYLIGTGLFISPDSFLALCWVGAIYFLYEALVEDRPVSWSYAGIFLGLGLLSKYTIVLLGIPIAAFMIIDPKARSYWKMKEPYMAAVIALLIFSPVIWWNVTHHFASFAFQSTRRVEEVSRFYLHRVILDMMILILPSTLIAGVLGVITISQPRVKVFASLFVGLPTAVFLYFSLSHDTKLNWTGPGLLLLIPFASYWLHNVSEETTLFFTILKKSFTPVAVVLLCLFAVTVQYLGYGLPGVGYGQKLHRILGWQAMAEQVIDEAQTFQVMTNQAPVIVGMDKHFIAANFSFYAQKLFQNKSPYDVGSRNIIGEPALMWDFWSPPETFIGRVMILVSKNEADLADGRIKDFFTEIEPIKTLELYTRGKQSKTYFIRIGHGYKGPPAIAGNEMIKEMDNIPNGKEDESRDVAPDVATPSFSPAPPELNRS